MPVLTDEIWGEDGPPSILFAKRLYRERGLEFWNNARVQRVCHKLDCTLEELCALANLFRPQFFTYYRKDRWPGHIALVFSMIEQAYDETRLGQRHPPPIPLEFL